MSQWSSRSAPYGGSSLSNLPLSVPKMYGLYQINKELYPSILLLQFTIKIFNERSPLTHMCQGSGSTDEVRWHVHDTHSVGHPTRFTTSVA